jgi:hypothetical protein
MPDYEIEQYELHTSKYRVAAASEAEAIAKLFRGEGELVDNSLEFIEVADYLGIPAEEHPQLAAALQKLDVRQVGDVIPSIRSIEQL